MPKLYTTIKKWQPARKRRLKVSLAHFLIFNAACVHFSLCKVLILFESKAAGTFNEPTSELRLRHLTSWRVVLLNCHLAARECSFKNGILMKSGREMLCMRHRRH